jgi:dTDP-4-amino-4,6-dideoxygalactose transaminase
MAGDITIQPAFEKFNSRVIGSLPITKKIHDNSFFFGNHPLIKDIERSHIIDSFDEFLGKFTNET